MWVVLILLWGLSLLFPHSTNTRLLLNLNIEILYELNFWLVLLSIWCTRAMVISSSTTGRDSSNEKISIFVSLLMCLYLCFSSENLIFFYFFFELSLIPILALILGWGYQPERLFSGISMLFYTLVASLPLLIVILILLVYFKSVSYYVRLGTIDHSNRVRLYIYLPIVLGFLVKLPIFGPHLWLPRAHVEAPVYGSMILAAVLLKLGVAGLFIFSFILTRKTEVLWFLQRFSCVGGSIARILCLLLRDIKTLIAYSSVAHIGLLTCAIFMINKFGIVGTTLIAVAHGIVSSGLFWGRNVLYKRSATRSLLIVKRSLNFTPLFSFIWFVLCLGNIGAPPTLNLISEIYIIIGRLANNLVLIIPVLTAAFMATAFTLNLYIATQHNQSSSSLSPYLNLHPVEILLGVNHIILVLWVPLIFFFS